jgi:hypothetical protein
MPTQIADIIVPAEFTAYIVENSLVSSALFQSPYASRKVKSLSPLITYCRKRALVNFESL